jgi:hypothetical protein
MHPAPRRVRLARARGSRANFKQLRPQRRPLARAVRHAKRHEWRSLSDYGARCLTQDGALVVTVYAPQPQVGQRPPLVTFGVAHRSRQGAALWTELLKVGPAAPGTREPHAPWCGVHVHPSIVGYMDALSWLGDFERCVAWAWISKHDPRGF